MIFGHLVHLLASPRFVMVVKPSGLMRFMVAINLLGIISPSTESLVSETSLSPGIRRAWESSEPGHQLRPGDINQGWFHSLDSAV